MLERREMKRQHSSSLFDTRPRGDFTQLHIPTKCIQILLGKWFERLGNMSAAMMIASTSNDFLSCPRELWSKSFLELINVGGKSPFSHHYQLYISSCLTLCGTQNFGTYNVQKSLKYMSYAENLGCCCSIRLLGDVAFIPLWVRSAFHCLPFMSKGGREN